MAKTIIITNGTSVYIKSARFCSIEISKFQMLGFLLTKNLQLKSIIYFSC